MVDGAADGSARVLMTGEVTLTGKLASLVESGAGVVVSRMTKDFSAKLVAKCAEPAAATAPVSPVSPVSPQESVPAGAAGPAATEPAAAPAPAPAAAAPARPGVLRRCLAWLGRLLGRRQDPPPTAAPRTPHPTQQTSSQQTAQTAQTRQTEEVGSGNAPAQ